MLFESLRFRLTESRRENKIENNGDRQLVNIPVVSHLNV